MRGRYVAGYNLLNFGANQEKNTPTTNKNRKYILIAPKVISTFMRIVPRFQFFAFQFINVLI